MPKEIIPQLDVLGNDWVEAGMNTDWANEAEAFAEENPNFYCVVSNSAKLLHWLQIHDVPPTRANLTIAYRECMKAGVFFVMRPVKVEPKSEPVQRGVIRVESTVRLPYTAPNNEATWLALDKHLSDLREMSPIGKPVGENLKRAYQHSLARERKANYTRAQINAAKANVGLNHSEVKRESLTYNRLVAEFLADGKEGN